MAVGEITAPHPARPGAPGRSMPEQSRRRPAPSPADRIGRQARAIDAWLLARRGREQALLAARLNRDERTDAARELQALQQTHDAIKGRCARCLDADMDALESPGVTAVVAHRHAWFVDKLTLLLGSHGVTVIVSTDNGAEALGAVVAEQPDIVLVGDRLAMLRGRDVLAESRLYASDALLTAQASDPQEADTLSAAADSVFLRQHSPAVMADTLVVLHRDRAGSSSTLGSPEGSLR